MKKPELKVVRFDAEDVIATSAQYFTYEAEWNQSQNSGDGGASGSFVTLRDNGSKLESVGYGESGWFVWYHGDSWYTSKSETVNDSKVNDKGATNYDFKYSNGDWNEIR